MHSAEHPGTARRGKEGKSFMPFEIIRNDITKVRADVIVNTANPALVIGGGTDGAIYRAAGEEQLMAARRRIGAIAPGDAAVTPAFRLQAKHIIHTVGPAWTDGRHGERDVLRSCYARSLALAAELSARSIAFPLIATGSYGFPRDEALNIALAEIGKFLLTHEMKVILVVFDRRTFELSEELVGEIEAYVDDHGVDVSLEEEYARDDGPRRLRSLRDSVVMEEMRNSGAPKDELPMRAKVSGSARPTGRGMMNRVASPVLTAMEGKSLDEVLDDAGQSFQQRLLELIDSSGMDDVSVYKKANVDRKLFSRIRCKTDYKPTKKTAVAFAIALKLDLPTMLDLLSRAGIAFSPSNKFDLIITYFVSKGNYDIFEINAALFKYGQAILGE